MTRVFVSADMASIALGADGVADALAQAGAEVTRTGSRGLFAIEPLVEVETEAGRIGYGPVTAADAARVLIGDHPRRLGQVEALPFFARQQRLTFARCGVTDPLSLADYAAHGGWRGLAADEGDSGTFADRMLMEGDPFLLIEGMAIAGHAVGADYGYVYIRSEYPLAIDTLRRAIDLSADRVAPFGLEVRVGAGAYVCGEETSLLDSIEGKRGQVRAKPPLPAHVGLFGAPTVINNVLTLAAAPFILAEGPEAYAELGYGRSRGTMPVQLAGNVKNGGLFETPFGITLGELVNDIGGGTESGRPVRAVQVGGPLGAYFPPSKFDLPFDYEAFAAEDGLIGHAGVVVFDDTVDMGRMARFAMEFCAIESCGKCTPCRIGSVRGVETIDRLIAGGQRPTDPVEALAQMRNAAGGARGRAGELALLRDLCDTMRHGSLCALGGFTPYPVLSALKYFPEDFGLTAEMAELA